MKSILILYANGHLFWAGLPVTSAQMYVRSRWNIIGSISVPIPVSAITSDSVDFVTSPFYEYDGIGYRVADTIKPGHGYWVKASEDGVLILNTSLGMSGIASGNAIRILNSGELPPAPPGVHPSERGSDTHDRFVVSQNYPNPFNPTTTLEFTLSEPSYVTVRVFNVLGQQVGSLLSELKDAGEFQVSWNASDAPTGIYFYRLEATSLSDPAKTYSATRKMLLVR
jgi:hypothetical protein